MITPVRRVSLLPLALLVAFGTAWASGVIGTSLLAVDDHPGQYFRLWHVLHRGLAPWTWNPDWWMGFAEFQFYPPGFAYLGVAVHYLGLTSLSAVTVYQTLLWLIFLAPGITAFLLLSHLLPTGWLALPGALIVLTLSADTQSGVEGGVRIGMIAARLGWALLPLLAYFVVRWADLGAVNPGVGGKRTRQTIDPTDSEGSPSSSEAARPSDPATPRREEEESDSCQPALPRGVERAQATNRAGRALLKSEAAARPAGRWGNSLAIALTLAAIVLSHPAHAPAGVLYVFLGALLTPGAKRPRLLEALVVMLLTVGLTAFWLLPLLAHLKEARGLAWGDSAVVALRRSFTAGPLPSGLLLLGAASLAVKRDRAAILLVLFVPLMLGVIGLDRSDFLPANRLLDSVWLGLALAAGLGLGRWVATLWERQTRVGWVAATAIGGLVVALAAMDPRTVALWPTRSQWPTLAELITQLRLPELWRLLDGAPPGRVLFVRSSIPLHPAPPGARGTHPWYRAHSHVTSLTPLATGRPIINGTFTHSAALAALAYRGSLAREPVRKLVEQLDGERLFGVPLATMPRETLDRFIKLFGVTAVVMLTEDEGGFPALEQNPRFRRERAWPHVVFVGADAVSLPRGVAPGHWRVDVSGAPDRWVSARVAYSPLWTARAGSGALAVRRGDSGDLEVRLPSSSAQTIDIVYRPGRVELVGTILTALTLLAGLGFVVLTKLYTRNKRA